MRRQPRESSDVRVGLEESVSAALRERGWWPPEDPRTRHHVTWEEVAFVAVDIVSQELGALLLRGDTNLELNCGDGPPHGPSQHPSKSNANMLAGSGRGPWLDADEVAPLLNVTPHTLRRLAREDRCPIVVRRIGGRWRFARRDLERYLGEDAPDRARPRRGS
jgi:excisionase family DNA binding protein